MSCIKATASAYADDLSFAEMTFWIWELNFDRPVPPTKFRYSQWGSLALNHTLYPFLAESHFLAQML